MDNYFDTPDTLTTSSILALFETNKDQRKSFVNDVLQRLNDGQLNPLEVHLQVKAMEDIIKQLTADKDYKNFLDDAARNQSEGQRSFVFHNAEFTKTEVGTKYDYEVCQDTVWEMLNSQINGLVEQRKQREKFLQTVPVKGLVVTDELSGETVKIYPPSKSSTSTIAVKLK